VTSTWYVRSSPPKVLISTTPGTDRRRGAICDSSTSRSTMARSFSGRPSPRTSNWKISPRPDEIGAISGSPKPSGIASRASVSRSETIWRAQ
jgi:hypothetical protein